MSLEVLDCPSSQGDKGACPCLPLPWPEEAASGTQTLLGRPSLGIQDRLLQAAPVVPTTHSASGKSS